MCSGFRILKIEGVEQRSYSRVAPMTIGAIVVRSKNMMTTGAQMKAEPDAVERVEGNPVSQVESAAERFSRVLKNEPDWTKVDTRPLLREMWQSLRQDMIRIWARRHEP